MLRILWDATLKSSWQKLAIWYLIIQVSLQVHAKAHFGAMTKCVDYAGVLIFKYPA